MIPSISENHISSVDLACLNCSSFCFKCCLVGFARTYNCVIRALIKSKKPYSLYKKTLKKVLINITVLLNTKTAYKH